VEQLYSWLDQGVIWLFFFPFLSNNPYGGNIFIQIGRWLLFPQPNLAHQHFKCPDHVWGVMPVSLFHFYMTLHGLFAIIFTHFIINMASCVSWQSWWTKSYTVIGYLGRQDGSILPWYSLFHFINFLLTMLVWSRWMDTSLNHFFCLFMDLNSVSETYKHKLKSLGQYPAIWPHTPRSIINDMYTLRRHVSSFSSTFFLFLASFSTLRENAFSCSLIYMQKKFRRHATILWAWGPHMKRSGIIIMYFFFWSISVVQNPKFLNLIG